MSKKLIIQKATVNLSLTELKDFTTQLNTLFSQDRRLKEQFWAAPNQFLSDCGLNIDLRREFLKDANITDTSPRASICFWTCVFTGCQQTIVVVVQR